MTQRKFLIDKSMIAKITLPAKTSASLSDFDELAGMLTLEAIQILDMGDPYEIKFKTRKDFNDLYSKYAEFSQIFSSLKIFGTTIKGRLPYLSTTVLKSEIPIKRRKYVMRYVDPSQLFMVNYWLKTPMEITLKPDIHLTLKKIIDWNLIIKLTTSLAHDCLNDLYAYKIMRELWTILPKFFPEV